VSESQPGGHGYYCYCVPFEVRSDADKSAEHGIGLLWLLGVLCEVCTEATETAEQRPYGTTSQNQTRFTLSLLRE